MIAKVLKEAADAIRGPEKPTTVPGFLRPIDTAWIARELNLEVQAAERGKSNIPPSTSAGPDSIERAFRNLRYQGYSASWGDSV